MLQVDQSTIKVTPLIAPAAAKTASFNSVVIDTLGFEELTFAVQSGVLTDGIQTGTLKYDDALSSGDLASAKTVPADEVIGTQPTFQITDDGVVKKFSVKVLHRYYRLDFVASGSPSSGGFFSGVAILGGAKYKPVS